MGKDRAVAEAAVSGDVSLIGGARCRRAPGAVIALLLALWPLRFAAAGTAIFANDFESGFSCAWSQTVPVPATCTDEILDDCETDVDCGGGQCALCADFELCNVHADCQSGLCDGNLCVECLFASSCPGTDTECQTRTCNAGSCGLLFEAFGFEVSEQTAGDCQTAVCDGVGGVAGIADNSDLPDDGLQCTDDLCVAGTPANQPSPQGTPCTENGGALCDGAGSCVQCVVASDCPGVDTECQARTCTANICGFFFEAFGFAVSGQTAGDCQVEVCDGAGGVVPIPDDGDIADDGLQCTDDFCVGGVPSTVFSLPGSPCDEGGGTECDGAGNCVLPEP